jgi:hypothetical protein
MSGQYRMQRLESIGEVEQLRIDLANDSQRTAHQQAVTALKDALHGALEAYFAGGAYLEMDDLKKTCEAIRAIENIGEPF